MSEGTLMRYAPVWTPGRQSFDRGTPEAEPVTVDEVKEQARVRHDDEDDVIARLIAAARAMVEARTGRLLMPRAVVWRISRFPPSERLLLSLPGGRALSITSVQYVDEGGDTQTWDAAEQARDLVSEPARIGVFYGASWPSVRLWDLAVTISYSAGYEGTVDDPAAGVPADLRHAVRLISAELYHSRELMAEGMSGGSLPFGILHLVDPHRIWGFG